MKQTVKRIGCALLVLALVFALTACGQKFDATAYVQGMLDAAFHGQASADFLKMTGDTEETVKEAYEQTIQNTIDSFSTSFLSSSGLGEDAFTDEAREQVAEMARILYSKTTFTAGEAEKTDTGYTVSLTIEPVVFSMSGLTDQLLDLQNDYVDKIMNGEIVIATEDDLAALMQDLVKEILDLCIAEAENAQTTDPVTTSVTLVNADNVIQFAEGELERLELEMVQFV